MCRGYTFIFNVPHFIISGSIASSPFSISWVFPLSRCANGSSSFSLSQSLNIHILLCSVSADRNTSCDRYAVCEKKKTAAHGKSRCGSFLCHITLFAEFYVCSSMFKACSDKYFYIALVAFLSHSSSSPSKSGLIAANTFAWYAFNLSFSSAVMQDTSTASRSNGTIVSGSKPMN